LLSSSTLIQRGRAAVVVDDLARTNVDPFTNTVRVTIARLRRKLGQPDVIHTTPGLGYRITETLTAPAKRGRLQSP
jgi:DNA-binding response OmpR family regulator